MAVSLVSSFKHASGGVPSSDGLTLLLFFSWEVHDDAHPGEHSVEGIWGRGRAEGRCGGRCPALLYRAGSRNGLPFQPGQQLLDIVQICRARLPVYTRRSVRSSEDRVQMGGSDEPGKAVGAAPGLRAESEPK